MRTSNGCIPDQEYTNMVGGSFNQKEDILQ